MSAADRRQNLFRAYENAAGVVSAITADQLRLPTPCPKYDVAALVDHLVGAGHMAASMGEGTAAPGEEFPHIELSDAPGEIRQARKAAEAAWSADEKLEQKVTMPWGEVYDGYTVVNMYLAELAAHAWDLAASTGQVSILDAELATVALEGARSMLKPEYRDLMEEGSPFGLEVEAPADADDWEKLAAFMGRQPRPVTS